MDSTAPSEWNSPLSLAGLPAYSDFKTFLISNIHYESNVNIGENGSIIFQRPPFSISDDFFHKLFSNSFFREAILSIQIDPDFSRIGECFAAFWNMKSWKCFHLGSRLEIPSEGIGESSFFKALRTFSQRNDPETVFDFGMHGCRVNVRTNGTSFEASFRKLGSIMLSPEDNELLMKYGRIEKMIFNQEAQNVGVVRQRRRI